MRKPNICLTLIAIVLLVACAPDDAQSPAEAQATASPQPTVTMAEPAQAPTSTTAADPDPTASPTIAEPSATVASAATEPPAEMATPEEAATEVAINGRTDDGAYFLGRADAPVTIVDYSDFL